METPPHNVKVIVEARSLHRDAKDNTRKSTKAHLIRNAGAKFITLLIGAARPFYVSAHYIETRKPNADFDMRAVILISEQPIDPAQAEAMACAAPIDNQEDAR